MAGTPLIFGTTLFGGFYDFLLGVFLLPLFVSIWLMSRNLRQILFRAVLTAMDNKIIADRFDIALSNVSHGLAMYDSDGQFVVVNGCFAKLAGLDEKRDWQGASLHDFPDNGAMVEIDGESAEPLGVMLKRCLAAGRRTQFCHVLRDGRIIETKYHPMPQDGGVVVLEDITERVNSEEEIRKLASFDPLTHLPNRRFFVVEVNRLLGGPDGLSPCTVLFVDLDNFKDINDTLGHTIGDKLLCAIALRMRAQMPDKAMASRFGGDEFVIVVPGKITRKQICDFADMVIRELSRPIEIDGHVMAVGASIGIATSPDNGREYSQLLKYSDVALYDAKARGRGTYSFYTNALGDMVRDRRSLEAELRRALDGNQLELHYQPLIHLATGRINTFEALLRWNHPERGAISPAVFIPIAEEIGVITQIGKFVLEEATRQCRNWPDHVSVAVNVSSLQFQQSDVCAVVSHALKASGLDPRRLEVEVTESAMLENVAETTDVLQRLSKTGVRISLDDFGTGFSSLSYLHALPLDKVKIDRSFIENIHQDDRSMVLLSGITHLAKELGLAITIEGVETRQQMEILQAGVHVDEMQGFLFGKAMPAADTSKLLLQGNFETGPAQRTKRAASA